MLLLRGLGLNELVITGEIVLCDGQLGETLGSILTKVLLKLFKIEGLSRQFPFQIVGDRRFLVLSGGNVQGFDHQDSSRV
jgi:energy-converting hydrogenase Eha subunit B